MTYIDDVAREALRAALAVRRRAGVSKDAPVCVYDLAEKLGVEVMFSRGNSFEGLFARESSTILISSSRPAGRQAFTCAHEMGHWHFGHGTRVDDIDLGTIAESREERLATLFAGYLLMPSWTVKAAYAARAWDPETSDGVQTYTIASQLGVGYETLVTQLRRSLGLVTERAAQRLLRTTPKQVREMCVPTHAPAPHLVIVDDSWSSIPIDLRVGDVALIPPSWSLEAETLSIGALTSRGRVVSAAAPGIGRIGSASGDRAVFVRVSRSAYEGRAKFRHLEDPDHV